MGVTKELRGGEGEVKRVMALWANVCSGKWVSHIVMSLCEGMAGEVPVMTYAHTLCDGYRSPLVVPAVPAWATSMAYRLERVRPFLHERTVRKYLAEVRAGDVCWVWPGLVGEAVAELRRRGAFIASEAINCHQGTARRILTEAYEREGWKPEGVPTAAAAAGESKVYEMADLVFAPSPLVAASMAENGVPPEKVVLTSYGWSPQRFGAAGAKTRDGRGVMALFVGTVCVRKGPHLLARAWREAGVKGRLVMAGKIEAPLTEEMLAGPGTELLGWTDQVPTLMREADIFTFPSLEEGSPLVVYEAAAMGMAIVTTPMGAGGVIRDGVEGIILEPYDHRGWVEALRMLAGDEGLRRQLGEAARARAQAFTWGLVARRRLQALRERVADRAGMAAAV